MRISCGNLARLRMALLIVMNFALLGARSWGLPE